jgi:hypothetical protein
MVNLSFNYAVLYVVIENFLKNQASFSAHDVTKVLRRRVGVDINISDALPTDDATGKPTIEHSAVRQAVHDAYEIGLLSNYTRRHASTNGISYWLYIYSSQQMTPAAATNTANTSSTMTLHSQNGGTTQTTNSGAFKNRVSTLSPVARMKVRDYINNRHVRGEKVTLKGIQGMIFRHARISSEDIANEVGVLGFSVVPQPGLKKSLAVVQ